MRVIEPCGPAHPAPSPSRLPLAPLVRPSNFGGVCSSTQGAQCCTDFGVHKGSGTTCLVTLKRMTAHPRALPDVQASAPTLHVSLSRVGVTGVEKVIRLHQGGVERLFSAQLECFVDLGPNQKGAHMSRFEETVNDAIGEVVLGEATFRAEQLAVRIAEL